MKKQLFLALLLTSTLLTVNCSGSNNDDDNTPTNPQPSNPQVTPYFHPPVWIQGTWGVSTVQQLKRSINSQPKIL